MMIHTSNVCSYWLLRKYLLESKQELFMPKEIEFAQAMESALSVIGVPLYNPKSALAASAALNRAAVGISSQAVSPTSA